ncbi:hypothetical protein Cni_G02284 [Canna indica]|uniref:Uncharacterized protein n=1 Tax=Canna indica TaxID=4628 RepID=A0AAQ3JR07_9LILI|nr:hypothetical protein Cni_G02284 [Canna indica]
MPGNGWAAVGSAEEEKRRGVVDREEIRGGRCVYDMFAVADSGDSPPFGEFIALRYGVEDEKRDDGERWRVARRAEG